MHPTEETLRAYADGELDSEREKEIAQHLKECSQCTNLFSEIRERSKRIQQKLELLDPPSNPAIETLLSRIQSNNMRVQRKSMTTRLRAVFAAAAAVLLVLVAWQFNAVRVWASEFLNLFRVQQITVVPIDPANIRQFDKKFFDSPENRPRLEQLFSDQVTVLKRGAPQTVTSANEAARVAGFGVRLPAKVSGSLQMKTHPAVDISVRIDVEKLQSVLDDAGRKDIRIPEELDGQTVNFHIPASVTSLFGKCPELKNESQERDDDREHRMERYPDCKVVVQLPSPSIVAPPSLNVTQLGQAMLQLAGLSEQEARKFSEKIDWSSTLVIPLPIERNEKLSDVEVDGVHGTLISIEGLGRYRAAAYNLMWVRDGILYSVMGQGNSDEAVQIANSLQ